MGVHLAIGYTLPGGDYPLTHARILHAGDWLAGGTIAGSSTAAGYTAAGAANSLTRERWKPTAVPAVLDYGHGSAVQCDCACIGAHTAGSAGAVLRVEYEGASRTNLLERSDEFDNASWNKLALSIVANAATAPDGTVTADKMVEDSTTGSHRMLESFSATSAVTYTFSVWAKAAELQYLQLVMTSVFAGTQAAGFQLSGDGATVVAGGATAVIEAHPGGWYRCSITATATSTATAFVRINTERSLTASLVSYLGDGASGVYLWRAQAEAGAAMTTGIATAGSTAASTWHAASGWITQTDDMPVMAIFEPITASDWRIGVTAAVCELGVVKFGMAMQMPRPLYGGHSPLQMARQTEARTNRTETGEWVGRSIQRTMLGSTLSWQHLEAQWIRDTWRPFQTAIQTDPYFLAWRPDTFSEVALCSTDETPVPQNMGLRSWMAVELNAIAHAWD